jgi:hypothetical protein
LSFAIAEKSRVNDDADTEGTLPLEPEPDPEPEDGLLLPQAAATRPAAATPAVITKLLAIFFFNEAHLACVKTPPRQRAMATGRAARRRSLRTGLFANDSTGGLINGS